MVEVGTHTEPPRRKGLYAGLMARQVMELANALQHPLPVVLLATVARQVMKLPTRCNTTDPLPVVRRPAKRGHFGGCAVCRAQGHDGGSRAAGGSSGRIFFTQSNHENTVSFRGFHGGAMNDDFRAH